MSPCFDRWRLGFNQFRLSHAHRTCGTSPDIPSGLAAFPACCFPLHLSISGRLGVLEVTLLSTSPFSEWNHHVRRSGAPSGHDLPLIRAFLRSLVCCPQARLRTFPVNDIPGTRGD